LLPPWDRAICLNAHHLGRPAEGILGEAGVSRRGAAAACLGEGGAGGDWHNPPAIKRMFNSADILRGGRIVFDLGGNKYRLVAWVNFHYGVVYVRFIGTHRQYDAIDPQTV
jgi:mRNA-degrading endonuclease HigB of HigAB toxin-antitoxin module